MDVSYHPQSQEEDAIVTYTGMDTQRSSYGDMDLYTRVPDSKGELGKFLERPVLVDTITWATNVRMFGTIDVWGSFMNDKRVANRINNYTLFRGKLKLRIVASGNPFFSGRSVFATLPAAIRDAFKGDYTGTGSWGFEKPMKLCQMNHVTINPTESNDLELIFPFCWYNEYLNLSSRDPEELGHLMYAELAPLRHATSATTANEQMSISIYASVIDGEFLMPTSKGLFLGVTPQADEHEVAEHKPLSQMASVVERAAKVVAEVPALSEYARPVETIARGTKEFLQAHGLCKPHIVEAPSRITPRLTGNLTITNDTDTVERLCTDVKQGLTVDSKAFTSVDEMSFPYIFRKWTPLTQVTWSADLPDGNLLLNWKVSPTTGLWNGALTIFQPTAIGGLCGPFKYWSGTIEYKIEICKSQYHKGRLYVAYDPVGTSTLIELNTQYTNVVDISMTNEFTIKVPMSQESPVMTVEDYTFSSFAIDTVPISTTTGTNGVVSMFIANELTSPAQRGDATVDDDVTINVYIRGGEDFKVHVPTLGNLMNYQYHPESKEEDTVVKEEVSLIPLTKPLYLHNHIGESIDHLRQILKRYCWYMYLCHPAHITEATEYRMGVVPYPFGDFGTDGQFPSNPAPERFNYVGQTFTSWYMMAYSAHRGSQRLKMFLKSNSTFSTSAPTLVMVERVHTASGDIVTSDVTLREFGAGITQSFAAHDYTLTHINPIYGFGHLMFDVSVNPTIDVEIPFYSQFNKIVGKFTNPNSQATNVNGIRIVIPNNSGMQQCGLDMHHAAGEDFTLGYFTGFPRIALATVLPPL